MRRGGSLFSFTKTVLLIGKEGGEGRERARGVAQRSFAN